MPLNNKRGKGTLVPLFQDTSIFTVHSFQFCFRSDSTHKKYSTELGIFQASQMCLYARLYLGTDLQPVNTH